MSRRREPKRCGLAAMRTAEGANFAAILRGLDGEQKNLYLAVLAFQMRRADIVIEISLADIGIFPRR
jgi:hypothetical protein